MDDDEILERLNFISARNVYMETWEKIIPILNDDFIWREMMSNTPVFIGGKVYSIEDVNAYIQRNYPNELNNPEVQARILGSKENI